MFVADTVSLSVHFFRKIDTNPEDMSTPPPPATQYLCKKGKYEKDIVFIIRSDND